MPEAEKKRGRERLPSSFSSPLTKAKFAKYSKWAGSHWKVLVVASALGAISRRAKEILPLRGVARQTKEILLSAHASQIMPPGSFSSFPHSLPRLPFWR